jgi:hypothetical protein
MVVVPQDFVFDAIHIPRSVPTKKSNEINNLQKIVPCSLSVFPDKQP